MKKASLFLTAAMLLFMSFVSSCKKEEEDDDHHTSSATITIDSPLASAFYNTNDTVKIKATITGQEELHG